MVQRGPIIPNHDHPVARKLYQGKELPQIIGTNDSTNSSNGNMTTQEAFPKQSEHPQQSSSFSAAPVEPTTSTDMIIQNDFPGTQAELPEDSDGDSSIEDSSDEED